MKRTILFLILISLIAFSRNAFAGMQDTQESYSGNVIDSPANTQDTSWESSNSGQTNADVDSSSDKSGDIEI